MCVQVGADALVERGLAASEAATCAARIAELDAALPPVELWRRISRHILKPEYPFEIHSYVHDAVFASWDFSVGPPPAWSPEQIESTNIAWLMRKVCKQSYEELYKWSIEDRPAFWGTMIERLNIRFRQRYSSVLDLTEGPEHPRWLPGAKLNIVDSCFYAPDDSPAIVLQQENGNLESMTIGQLRALTFRVANGLVNLGARPGDRVGIDMPMTSESVAIYLGVVAAGCSVVSIADSYAPEEIRTRLGIAPAVCTFTQDYALRLGKQLPIYEKVRAAGASKAIVLSQEESIECDLRDGDILWDEFLSDNSTFSAVSCTPSAATNILFSSGTTGRPKAIPWDHTTPMKSAIDGHLHHDIHPADVICWPTNLGWMMGPWLVYAALINRATIALYCGAPTTREFGQFVQDAGVTMLGLVPSLVAAWKSTGCMDGLGWSHIRAFSSTGECSNSKDMLFLMSLAGYKPVIEYCGGTEIGGGYITGTVVQPSAPGTFSTPTLGSPFVILDEQGRPSNKGEVFLVPPSLGWSQELLNADHHEVYFAGTPRGPNQEVLRRHGDELERFANGYFKAHGRTDDSMNLSGIKVSPVQIEEVVNGTGGLQETAAIAISPPEGGPSQLVIYAVIAGEAHVNAASLKTQMQDAIRKKLNPLFKIHDVVIVDGLPRTASNKVMRRTLRAQYEKQMSSEL